MGAPTAREKPILVGVGIAADIHELSDPLGLRLCGDDPGNITQKVTVTVGRTKKAMMIGHGRTKVIGELGANFVTLLANHGTKRHYDAVPRRALPLHSLH